jgi:glycosidase
MPVNAVVSTSPPYISFAKQHPENYPENIFEYYVKYIILTLTSTT